LVEEVLRVYGFNNIEIKSQMKISLDQDDCHDKWKTNNEISAMLVSKGLCEAQNNSLVNTLYWEKLGLSVVDDNVVSILNFSSRDLDVLRKDLLFSALITVAYNLNRRNKDLKFFEFGKGYAFDKKYSESEYLSIFLVGNRDKESWRSKGEKVDSFYLRKLVESVFYKLGVDLELNNGSEVFKEGFSYFAGSDLIADGGLVNDNNINVFDIKDPIYFAQIDMGKLMGQKGIRQTFYKPLNKYPSIRRDLSLLLNNGVSFDDIKSISFKEDKKLLTSVDLFDVYEGKGIENGMKSYAISFIFENEQKTMTDKYIDGIMNKIMAALENELDAKLR
jgi:phenylalanyl-tRNA synthetase beta chain